VVDVVAEDRTVFRAEPSNGLAGGVFDGDANRTAAEVE
jgi:hypothetical protein